MNLATIHVVPNPMRDPIPKRIHGGTDALGLPVFDFSTNSNACGPCLMTQEAVAQADASRYPDASYTVLRGKLAAFHGCEPQRIVIAGSASEFIFRITALAKLQGVSAVFVPPHSFGDYTHAAQAWGLPLAMDIQNAGLIWHCQPSSPLGQVNSDDIETSSNAIHVLDLAYAPLQLSGMSQDCPSAPILSFPRRRESIVALVDSRLRGNDGSHDGSNDGSFRVVWQLYSPNKALGLTGVRAAYAIAPLGMEDMVHQLGGLSASWPLGAHGVALLDSWVTPDVQTWLASSLQTLQVWKTRQIELLESLGWICQPSITNFFCATPNLPNLPKGLTLEQVLTALRRQGIKLRDTTSFGLPGQVRVSVQPPAAQDALQQAWLHINKDFK
jgi:histidinol-phosphate aminotransferase